MIVLLVSAAEAQSLIQGEPDRALCAYIKREFSLERILPDDNLPETVTLRQLTLDGKARHYVAIVSYATTEAADRAWAKGHA